VTHHQIETLVICILFLFCLLLMLSTIN